MRKDILIALALVCVVALSGCDGKVEAIPHSNDVITVEDYHVSSTTPYANSVVEMGFFISNNGEYPVKRVEINFFNIQGFEVSGLFCEGAAKERDKCIFTDIDSGDYKKVSLTLKTPPEAVIKQNTNLRVDYYVNYSYFGVRTANIPIVNDSLRVKPVSAFVQSGTMYGPVQVDFEPPVGGTRIEDEQEIKEYWGVMGRPFQMKINFNGAGSSSTGQVMPVRINGSDITLKVDDRLMMVDKLACDLCQPGTDKCPSGSEGTLKSKKSLQLPGSLVCNFQMNGNSDDPEVVTTLELEYNYTYEFRKAQVFEVQPYTD